MTKKEIINHIQSLLQQEDKTRKYHENVVAATVERVFNQFFYTLARSNPRELDDYTTSYGDSTALTVLEDATTGVYYTTLPVQFVPLPDKRSGVRHVLTAEQGEVAFFPMTTKEFDLAPNTLMGQMTERIGYIVRGTKVEYYSMNSTVASAGVRMHIIVPFSDLALTDEVKFPYGFDGDIMATVLELLRAIPPKDLTDNNSENG